MGAYYIVTDLELRSRFDPAILDAELQRAGLHGSFSNGHVAWWAREGPTEPAAWRANYSSSKRCCRHPAEALEELVEIVENLSPEAREVWDRCDWRRFDMGFECYDDRFFSKWQIKPPLLRRLAEVNGNLMITVYRNDCPASDV